MKPRIVIIGGREVGKTSAIQMTWADEIVNYHKSDDGVESNSKCKISKSLRKTDF